MLISPSAISTFNTCPYKFKILYIDNRKPLYKAEFEFGKKIHSIIAQYYKLLTNDITPNEVPSFLAIAIKKVIGNADENIIKYLKGFEEFEKQRLLWHINPKPMLIESEITKGNITGVIDAMFKRNGENILVDWKTGSTRDPNIDEHLKIQGNIYMYLTNAKEMYFIFIRYNTWHKIVYDENFILEKLKNFIEAYNNKNFPRNEGQHCERCEVNLHCYFDKYNLKWWYL